MMPGDACEREASYRAALSVFEAMLKSKTIEQEDFDRARVLLIERHTPPIGSLSLYQTCNSSPSE